MNQIFTPQDKTIKLIYKHLISEKRTFDRNSVYQITCDQLSQFVETAFWSSLRSNEGRTTRLHIALVEPHCMSGAVPFASEVSFDEDQIVKLAPAVPRSGSLLVNGNEQGLHIWGFSHVKPICKGSLVVEVSEPGIVRLSIGEFQPFAILDGRANPVIAGTKSNLAEYLNKLLYKEATQENTLESQIILHDSMALVALARMIVAEGHGGTLLIIPNVTGNWSESLNPFTYRYAAPDSTIRDLLRSKFDEISSRAFLIRQLQNSRISDELKNLVIRALAQMKHDISYNIKAVATLSGFDGATVITRDFQVMGFGAKIAISSNAAPHVCMFKPEPGSQKVVPSPLEHIGGTRHQSAARFVATHQDCVALVVSQDRHLSIVHWHEPIHSVAVVRNAEWWL